jgi:hypothetical protein
MPLIVNSVTTPSSEQVKIASARIDGTGTPSIVSQDGTWIDSITDTGVGDWSLVLTAGTFSATAHCTVSPVGSGNCMRADPTTTTNVDIDNSVCTTGAAGDVEFNIICVGAK